MPETVYRCAVCGKVALVPWTDGERDLCPNDALRWASDQLRAMKPVHLEIVNEAKKVVNLPRRRTA